MFRVENGSWEQLKNDAQLIRTQVFIVEQKIAEPYEWDDQDAISQHFIVYDQDKPIATARILKNHSVGRVAVLEEYRGKGIGRLMMLEIIAEAQKQHRPYLQLSSQFHATSFYENLGFNVLGHIYDDCEIPHINMMIPIKSV